MDHVQKNVFRDTATHILYKLTHKYPSYNYYGCYDGDCAGRLRLDHNGSKLIIENHSIDHGETMENDFIVNNIGRDIINMAQDEQYSELNSRQIIDEVLKNYENVTVPADYYDIAGKSVRNARHRIKRGK